MKRVFALILVFWGMFMPRGVHALDEPGDSLPNWVTSTIEVKTYRVLNPVGDSLFFARFQSSDLGRALNQSGVVNVFQYGPSGTACLMRSKGLSPDHTQVLWNQFPINSLTLGQTDLSMIPVFFIDGIRISSPSFYELNANTGIGGDVNISSELRKSKHPILWIQSEYSSLNNIWNGLGCQIIQPDKWGCPIKMQLRVFASNNANEFRFQDPYSPSRSWSEQANNNAHSRGLQFQLERPARRGNWVAQFWTVDRMAQLPSIIGVQNGMRQKQWDNQNRISIHFDRESEGYLKSWKSGVLALVDRQTYWMYNSSLTASNDTSMINAYQASLFSEMEWRKNNHLFTSRVDGRVVNVTINDNSKRLMMPQWTAHWHQNLSSRILLHSAVKVAKAPEFLWNKTTMGSVTWLGSGKWFKQLKLQGQYVERAPDFNELYWPQSGNSSLKSEQSLGSAFYAALEYQRDHLHRFRTEGNLENRWVKNWIQWTPQSNGLWRPMNIQNVESWHAEIKVLGTYHWKGMQFQWLSFAEWNHVQGYKIQSTAEHFFMPYVPQWKVCQQLDIQGKVWSMGMCQRWISARYTDQNNTESMQLPAVELWNIFLGREFRFGEQHWNAQIRVENILNTQYQEVRSYAIPGRVISFQINYQIK